MLKATFDGAEENAIDQGAHHHDEDHHPTTWLLLFKSRPGIDGIASHITAAQALGLAAN